MSQPEKKLEALVRFSLGAHFRNSHLIWKFHADEFSGAGQTDFYGHIEGQYVGLELKVAPGYFTPAQKTKIAQITETGGFAAGILEVPDDGVYLLLPFVVMQFSYRHREHWLLLSETTVQGRRVLNLSILRPLLLAQRRMIS